MEDAMSIACLPSSPSEANDARVSGVDPLVAPLIEPRMARIMPCAEFAREARMPLRTVQLWCQSGKLDAFWSPWARQWLVREGELARVASMKEACHE